MRRTEFGVCSGFQLYYTRTASNILQNVEPYGTEPECDHRERRSGQHDSRPLHLRNRLSLIRVPETQRQSV